jgi:hypothetical protein
MADLDGEEREALLRVCRVNPEDNAAKEVARVRTKEEAHEAIVEDITKDGFFQVIIEEDGQQREAFYPEINITVDNTPLR